MECTGTRCGILPEVGIGFCALNVGSGETVSPEPHILFPSSTPSWANRSLAVPTVSLPAMAMGGRRRGQIAPALR
jgi:hypothetical protein